MTPAPQGNNEVAAFDAASLGTSKDAEKPVWFEIANNRDGSPTGLQFQLVGKDSKEYRALNRKLQNKRLDTLAKTRKLKMTAEENEAETLMLLVACVKSFRSRLMKRVDGVLVPLEPEQFEATINIEGEKLPYTHENVKRTFTTVPEIKEQIEDFLADRVNFIQESQIV